MATYVLKIQRSHPNRLFIPFQHTSAHGRLLHMFFTHVDRSFPRNSSISAPFRDIPQHFRDAAEWRGNDQLTRKTAENQAGAAEIKTGVADKTLVRWVPVLLKEKLMLRKFVCARKKCWCADQETERIERKREE